MIRVLLSHLPQEMKGKGQRVASLPHPSLFMTDEYEGQLLMLMSLGAHSPVSPSAVSALLGYLGEMQVLLSWLLQVVKCMTISQDSRPQSQPSHLLQVVRGRGTSPGVGGISLPLYHHKVVEGRKSSSMLTFSLAPLSVVSGPLCCPGKMHGLHSLVLQLVRNGYCIQKTSTLAQDLFIRG